MVKSKEKIEIILNLDFSNPREVREAISRLKDCPGIFSGRNQNNEEIEISFFSDSTAELRTFQNNGWERVNYYSCDGECERETFEGKWR